MSASNSESAKEERVETATSEYAFWIAPDSSYRVEYSLPLFHELDFEVSEGYRRIPHGGIEIGGFLWGRIAEEMVRVEAFRQITCEHAAGPSFLLSDRDKVDAVDLLKTAHQDEELAPLQPVGWFISHTRGTLTLTDRELALFDDWFPEPGRISLLVKPERFQPTRFGFLVRPANGVMGRDAAPGAVILPLPGRAGKGMSASIPAPTAKPMPKNEAGIGTQAAVPEKPPAAAPFESSPKNADVAPVEAKMAPSVSTAAKKQAGTSSSISKAAAKKLAEVPPPVVEKPVAALRQIEKIRNVPFAEPPVETHPAVAQRVHYSSVPRLFFLLLLAAALGCGVGYFVYLQLPSPYIPLQAERRDNNLVVRWPADQTRNVEIAALRVNDGQPKLLTSEQKSDGLVEIQPTSDNTKVELIAQHWIRESRGIIRYVSEAPASSSPASAAASPVQGSPAP